MPSLNLFRRHQPDRPTLRERAASAAAGLARVVRKPAATAPVEAPATVDEVAELDFSAYDLDTPMKTPQQWAAQFAAHAMSMHVADRTLRMSKPEVMAFIQNAGERDAELPEIMLKSLDGARETFANWSELLEVARSRYVVAASAASLEGVTPDRADGAGAADIPQAAHAEQVALASLTGDVLDAGGIDHCDGTVSYADATGKVSRQPLVHWIAFTALQMQNQVQAEMGRRRMIEAGDLSGEEHAAWEARIRRELRSDAVHALTFRHDRAFEAAQALRTGAEPSTQALREQGDAELLALAPLWEAAVDLYQQKSDEETQIGEAASEEGWPGPAPDGAGPEWQAWFQQKEAWRERTGVAAAEQAACEAGTALYELEVQIADLSAASLCALKLKARVAQRSDDLGQEWVVGLDSGLVRDILALTEAQAQRPASAGPSLVGMLDLASATMNDLRVIRDLADHVGGVAYAHAWGERCHERTNAYGAAVFNDAGRLMQWVGDALTEVETAIHSEARRRSVAHGLDRETRLSMLAVTIIDNGDPDETEAFARELLDHVQAERQRR